MGNKNTRRSQKRKTGKTEYYFYDKYGKKITFNTATYEEARSLAKPRGLSHISPRNKDTKTGG